MTGDPRRLGFLPALLVLMVVVVARQAAAEQGTEIAALPEPANPEARKLMIEGNEAYDSALAMTDEGLRQRDLADAIRLYRAGAAKEPTHFYTFLWNLGLAYRRAGNYQEAIHFYQNFIDRAPKQYAAHRAAAAKHIADMRKEMERDAMLAEPSAPAPAPLSATPAASGDVTAVPLRLAPPPQREPLRDERRWFDDRPGWALAGGGAVGALVGGGLLFSAGQLYDRAASEDRNTVAKSLEDRGRTRVILGGIVGGLGVAALAAGVIKLSSHDRDRPRQPSVHVVITPSGVALWGRI